MTVRARRAAAVLAVLACGGCSRSGSGATAMDWEGTWSGNWTNSTFGTTGPVTATVTFDNQIYPGTRRRMTVVLDLGGNVFGGGDPPAETFYAFTDPSRNTTLSAVSAVYGELTGSIDQDGLVHVAGTNVPGSVSSFQLNGVWGDRITLTAAIALDDRSTASAVASLGRQ